MKENNTHRKAFEFFYNNGDRREMKEVAEEFKKSIHTIYKWSKEFKWKDRAEKRDKETEALKQKIILEETEKQLRDEVRLINKAVLTFLIQATTDPDNGIRNFDEMMKVIKGRAEMLGIHKEKKELDVEVKGEINNKVQNVDSIENIKDQINEILSLEMDAESEEDD